MGQPKSRADHRATIHKLSSSVRRHSSVKPTRADGGRVTLQTSKRAATGRGYPIVTDQCKKRAITTRAWIGKSKGVKKLARLAQRPTLLRHGRRCTASRPLSDARTQQKTGQRSRTFPCATPNKGSIVGGKPIYWSKRKRNTIQRRKTLNPPNSAHHEPIPNRRVPNKPRGPTWA